RRFQVAFLPTACHVSDRWQCRSPRRLVTRRTPPRRGPRRRGRPCQRRNLYLRDTVTTPMGNGNERQGLSDRGWPLLLSHVSGHAPDRVHKIAICRGKASNRLGVRVVDCSGLGLDSPQILRILVVLSPITMRPGTLLLSLHRGSGGIAMYRTT